MKQRRGCSRLVYAIVTESESGTTYGEVKELAPVKSVTREIASESEDVWADNELQQKTYAGSKITRTFETTRIAPEVEAELLGNTVITSGTNKLFATASTGDKRPYIAVGYALHDGNPDIPCEVVWGYRAKVNSISQVANTIDGGTASEGQSVEIEFVAPKAKFTKTGERNLDLLLAIDETNVAMVEKWFAKVITPDNAETELA